MKMEWIKQVTNEELVAEMEAGYQHLNTLPVFSKEHRETYKMIQLIREEILFRMK